MLKCFSRCQSLTLNLLLSCGFAIKDTFTWMQCAFFFSKGKENVVYNKCIIWWKLRYHINRWQIGFEQIILNPCIPTQFIYLQCDVVRVLIGLFCCLSEMGGSSHCRSASPEYELDAFEFFSVILGTSVSATRQVYKTRDLPFTHLIMITLLFATTELS